MDDVKEQLRIALEIYEEAKEEYEAELQNDQLTELDERKMGNADFVFIAKVRILIPAVLALK